MLRSVGGLFQPPPLYDCFCEIFGNLFVPWNRFTLTVFEVNVVICSVSEELSAV